MSISRVYPCIRFLQSHFTKDDVEYIYTKEIRLKLLESLNKRFGLIIENDVYTISTFLDSSFGLNAFELNYKVKIKNKVKSLINAVNAINKSTLSDNVCTKKRADLSRANNYIFYTENSKETSDDVDKIINEYVRKISERSLTFWKNNEKIFP